MVKAGRIFVGALVGGVLLWAVLVAGCGREAGDPVVVSLDGRTVTLSQLAAIFERVKGAEQWSTASFEDRKAFAELVAKKELLVRNARDILGDELPLREQVICDRWLEKTVQSVFWPKVRAAIEVPQAYIDSLAGEMTEERYLRHVLCRKQEMAQEIHAKISQPGADFVTIANEYANQYMDTGDVLYADVGWITRPQLAPELGKMLYDDLAAEGQIGDPVETTRWGWHVLQLGGIRTREAAEAKADAEKHAETSYRSRKMQELIDKIKQDYAMEIVAENLGPLLLHFGAMHDSINALKMQAIQPDYQSLKPPVHRFPPAERDLPLVRWSGGVMTIGDFVQSLWKVDLDFWPTTGDENKIRTQVERRFMRWMLMEEAAKRGALEDPEIQRLLANKQDELFLDAYYNKTLAVYREAVTDADVEAYWKAHEQEYLSQDLVGYGYIRFPLDLRDLAWQTYEQLQSGAQWAAAVTSAHNVDARVESEHQIDPTATGPYPQYTEVARKFAPQPDGSATITEPQEVGNEWVILRVYFRQLPNTLTFEGAAPFVRRDLQRKILEDSLAATLGTIEERYHLKINEAALR